MNRCMDTPTPGTWNHNTTDNRQPDTEQKRTEDLNTQRDNEGMGNRWEQSWDKSDLTRQGEAKLDTLHTEQGLSQ